MYEKRRKTVERANYLREMAEMHREIYRAIRLHDPVEARKQMEQHLRLAENAHNMERTILQAKHTAEHNTPKMQMQLPSELAQ
jgi:GntR family transcriptional repressor for pyruvate dehydrogenase complex